MQAADTSLSIRRFLMILEEFEAERRPLSSSEIAAALEAPKSSVGNLLRALVEQGVLILDRRTNTYFPTVRFAELNAWIIGTWFPNAEFLARVDALRNDVGETVCLSTPSDLTVEVLHSAQGVNPITLNMMTGQRLWMPFSAIGNAYLATLPSSTFSALVQRFERVAAENERPFDPLELQCQIKQVRRAGFAVAYDGVTSEAGGVAMALPSYAGPRPLVLSIGGPSDRIRRSERDFASRLGLFARSIKRASRPRI